MLEIIQFPNPILLKPSEDLSLPLSDQDQKLIDDMLEVMQSDPDHYAGLSAVQVGILKRVCIVQRYDKEDADLPEWTVMINPELVYESKQKSIRWDGCLSVKYGKLFAKTSRASAVEVSYSTRSGKKETIKGEGFFSHVLQHELDHLNGILFLKYVKNPADFYTEEELDEME